MLEIQLLIFAFGNMTNINIQPVSSSIPVIKVREIDSVLRLKDGGIAILGGLMEIRSRCNDSSLPFINKVLLLGKIFKGTNDSDELIKLVILLRTTILEDTNSVDKADQKSYE